MPVVGIPFGLVVVIVLSVVLLTTAPERSAAQSSSQSLPDGFEHYLATEVHPTAAERKALLAGRPLTKLLPSDQSKEVFVCGAIWINASPAEYVRRVRNIEDFEKGGAFRITKKIMTRCSSRMSSAP